MTRRLTSARAGLAAVAVLAVLAVLSACSRDLAGKGSAPRVTALAPTGSPVTVQSAPAVAAGPTGVGSSDAPLSAPNTVSPPAAEPHDAGVGAPAGAAVVCPTSTKSVSTAGGLTASLKNAKAGDVIELDDGTYSGRFATTASGTEAAPIWLCGGPQAVLDGDGIKGGYAFHLDHASNWRLVGFSVTNGQKGVVVDGGAHDFVQGLTISDIGDEAVHLRSGTTYSVVRDNVISDTGKRKKKFGEGVYVGSAKSNWCTYSHCQPDPSNFNAVLSNRISRTTSESVDIKEGTRGGAVIGNTFDGAGGLTGADSWVDVKGSNWLIAQNVGAHSPEDGFQVHEVVDGWGNGNVFRANVAQVDGPGFGFHLAPVQDNVVLCDNKAVGAAAGLSNTKCTT